jgi:diguanylate cyclase (GGDEF)-like protein
LSRRRKWGETIPVIAGVAKSTKSAADRMLKILLIDRGDSSLHNFKKTLANKGLTLIKERSASHAIPYLKDRGVDLIVIGSSLSPDIAASSRFKRLASDIPVIFLYTNSKNKTRGLPSKSQRFYSLKDPLTFTEFYNWTRTHIKHKASEKHKNKLKSELASARMALRFFNEVTRTYIRTAELNKAVLSIMDKLKNTVYASAWSVLINHPAWQLIPLRATRCIKKGTIKKRIGLAGAVLGNGELINVQDTSKDKRFNRKVDGIAGLKIRTIMCAPIKIDNEVTGVVRLFDKTGNEPFSDNDLDLLKTASNYLEMLFERVLLLERIEKLSVTDELTGLYNFRYLNEAIAIELERGKRYGSLFSLIFMDIDDFKKVNEKFGHQVGSKLLVAIAKIIKKNLRKIDITSRYGGDEFVIILPQTSREVGFMVAERLRKSMERKAFLKEEGLKIRLTASFGVASFPDDARRKEELLKIADKAMYSGKFSTKNIVFAAMK